jgi:TM2 domain-containing membrane protein YozV
VNYADVTPEEMAFLQLATRELNENQKKYFYAVYSSKRKKAQEVLLFTLLGLVGVAGIHRIILGQITMGIVYFFTGGLFLVGTIMDIVNNKSITLKYNKDVAYESHRMAIMTN